MRVIIADDSVETRSGVERLIRDKFPELVIDGVFKDGSSLMNYLDNNIPDLMITDIRMSGFDGLEACQKLREHSVSANIILITAYKNFEYAKRAITYHVHDFLVKPFTSRQLTESVTSALTSSESTPFSEDNAPNTRQQFIVKKAKEYIKANYSDVSLSVAKIAEHLQVTPNYLSSIFSTETNLKLTTYIGHIRIDHAKTLLSSGMPLQDIAPAIGCTSVQYFYKLFKKETGMTPNEYQLRNEL